VKAWKLLPLALVPSMVGCIVNRLILIPGIGTILFSIQGPAVVVFCVWLGIHCARSSYRFSSALPLTQWPSAVCLLLYLWQFHICSDESRNLFLAGLSQMPGAPLFVYAAKLVAPFSNHSWGPPETLATTAISLAMLAVLFSCGYWWNRCRSI